MSEKITVPLDFLRGVIADLDRGINTYWGWVIEKGPSITIRRIRDTNDAEVEINK